VRQQFAALAWIPRRLTARRSPHGPELRSLAGQMSGMPAGGDALAVIGIVFIVLLILELTGVIDIFKKT
jgi:hypothetical protein